MTTVAILGSGRVSRAIAGKLAGAGREVLIGSRDPHAAASDWADSGASVTGVNAAAAGAEVVINATPGDTSVERLTSLRAELRGKVLVDVANATTRGEGGLPAGLVYPGESLAEHLQAALPETNVVKTLNTMLFMVMAAPDSLSTPATVFLSGDDAAAKAVVSHLLADLGWQPEQILDLGDIRSARGPEAAVLVVPAVLKARGMVPFAISVVA